MHKIYVTDYVTPISTLTTTLTKADPTMTIGWCASIATQPTNINVSAAIFVNGRDLSNNSTDMATIATYLKTKYGV